MANASAKRPSDAPSLQDLVAAQAARIAELEQQNARQSDRIVTLQEQLNLALARRFAARSEKLSPDQIRLFDEAESASALSPGDDAAATDEDAGIDVPDHRRRRGKRRPLPASLPRVEVRHELPENERCRPHDGRPAPSRPLAKANGLEPYAYLRKVYTELPKAQSVADIEALLPQNMGKPGLAPVPATP